MNASFIQNSRSTNNGRTRKVTTSLGLTRRPMQIIQKEQSDDYSENRALQIGGGTISILKNNNTINKMQ